MDAPTINKKSQWRNTLAAYPTVSEPLSYSSSTSSRYSPSPRSRLRQPLQPASVSRVKRQIIMNTPPRGTSWLNDQSPVSGQPQTPTGQCRSLQAESSPLVNPSSALLQDLLKEHRESRRPNSSLSEDHDGPTIHTPERQQPQQLQLDTTSERIQKTSSILTAGLKQPREMGIREMDQYISKINKQNFDLKLEIFHRTQQAAGLAKDLEKMTELEKEMKRLRGLEDEVQELRSAEEDNQRLRKSNSILRNEIDKRDHAVAEAVELICQLEAKIQVLERDCHVLTRPTTRSCASSDPNTPTPKSHAIIDIPRRTSSKRATDSKRHRRDPPDRPSLERAPSFLQRENRAVAASPAILVPSRTPSGSELSALASTTSFSSTNGITDVQSPRISALSECSELDLCGSSTEQRWLDQLEIPVHEAPPAKDSSNLLLDNGEFKDEIDNWTPRNLNAQSAKPTKQSTQEFDSIYRTDSSGAQSGSYLGSQLAEPLETIFGCSRLPPTPDTMCTAITCPIKHSSSDSLRTGKPYTERLLAKRKIAHSYSMDNFQSVKISNSSARPGSMGANVNSATILGFEADEANDALATSRCGLQRKGDRLFDQGTYDIRSFGYYSNVAAFGDGAPPSARYKPSSDSSFLPELAVHDWTDAAKSQSRSRKKGADNISKTEIHTRPLSMSIGSPSFRTRSESSTVTSRRHSLGSVARQYEPAGVPTLDLSSLEPSVQAYAPPGSRRRISFRPLFFNRPAKNPHRPQVPEKHGAVEQDDGAPPPVVPRARQMNRAPTVVSKADESNARQGHWADKGTHDSTGNYLPQALPHSFADSNIRANRIATDSIAVDSNDRRRRSSFGIIGWMKGASGIGSHKRVEAKPLKAATQLNAVVQKERVPTPVRSGRSITTAASNDRPSFALDIPYSRRVDKKN